MAKKQIIQVWSSNEGRCYGENDVNKSLADFRALIDELVAESGVEADKFTLRAELDRGWHDDPAEMSVWIEREETDAEYSQRVAEEKAKAEREAAESARAAFARAEAAARREREEYLRLKAKFEQS